MYYFQYLTECDKVLVMEEGKIVEEGTHGELMEGKKTYYNLVSHHQLSTPKADIDSVNEEDQESKRGINPQQLKTATVCCCLKPINVLL